MPPFSSKAGNVETKYTPLAEEAPLMDGSDTDLPLPRQKSRLARIRTQLPWILSAVLFVLLVASWTLRRSDECARSSFERGFDTELVPAKPHIRMHTIQYRGTPQFGADGEEYVDYLPGEVRYVGPPSDEIDEAWNELTKKRFFVLSAEEARAQWGEGYTRYWNEGWGGYAARYVPYLALSGPHSQIALS